RQWNFDNDYLNPNNFTVSKDQMDVDAINMTPTPNNLNVNTQESNVVEPAVAEGLVQDEMIDKVVVAEEGVSVASNTRGRSKGKKVATKIVLRLS
ncbi:hypothetical protein Tco_0283234, partial [Tanacetum coccineum]